MESLFERLARQRSATSQAMADGKLGHYDDTAAKDAKVAATTPAKATGLDTQALAHRRKSKHYVLNEAGIYSATKQIQELPSDGWSTHCIMGGNYHGFDIIPAVFRLAGEPIRHLTIATLSFSKRNMANLCHMLDEGQVLQVELLTSDYFAKADADIYAQAEAEMSQRNQRIGFTRNHAKVICLEFETAGNYSIESSANLRSCVNFEQFALHNDKELMHYHRGWITQLLDHHAQSNNTPKE